MTALKNLSIDYRNEMLVAVSRYAAIPTIHAGDLVRITEYGKAKGMTLAVIAAKAGVSFGSLNHALVKDRRGIIIASHKFYKAVALAVLGEGESE